MIQTKEYMKFLDSFKFVGTIDERFCVMKTGIVVDKEREITRFDSEDHPDAFDSVSLDLSATEGREIEKLNKKQQSCFEAARNELLSNIFSIERKEDKCFFLNIITKDFILSYNNFAEVYSYINNDKISLIHTQINNISKILSIYHTYITEYCLNLYHDWCNLLYTIIEQYKIKLTPQCNISILQTAEDILGIYNMLYQQKKVSK